MAGGKRRIEASVRAIVAKMEITAPLMRASVAKEDPLAGSKSVQTALLWVLRP
jgi:hypothetical protein